MDKDLKYFMRKEMMEEPIVEVDAPSSFKDENGNVLKLQFKKLNRKHIDEINDAYKQLVPAIDKKTGRPYLSNGKIVMQDTTDTSKALRHLVVESLAYPNLKDDKLMAYYKCIDAVEMPLYVFDTNEYLDVVRKMQQVLGLGMYESDEVKDDIESAKN